MIVFDFIGFLVYFVFYFIISANKDLLASSAKKWEGGKNNEVDVPSWYFYTIVAHLRLVLLNLTDLTRSKKREKRTANLSPTTQQHQQQQQQQQREERKHRSKD